MLTSKVKNTIKQIGIKINDYFVAVFNGDENISRQVGRGLNECYSSNGYVILNSLNISYDLDRVVRYLYEQKYKTN